MAIRSTMMKINSGASALRRFGNGLSKGVKVNNRSISTSGVDGFSQKQSVSQRIEMRRMQSKLNTSTYENNELAKRRLQQKVATTASEVYGMDRSKLTKHWQGTASSGLSSNIRTIDTGKHAQTLADKVNLNLSNKKD